MISTRRWSLLLLLVLAPAAEAQSHSTVKVRDDFAQDSLTFYQTKGLVRYQDGRVHLGPGGQLSRPLRLGPRADLRCAIQVPDDQDEHGLGIRLHGDGAAATVFLHVGPDHVVLAANKDLERPYHRPRYAPGETRTTQVWNMRCLLHYGLVWARAWPDGEAEPDPWALTSYTGQARRDARDVTFFAGPPAGARLLSWEARGPAPDARTGEAARRAEWVENLAREVVELQTRGQGREALDKARQAVVASREVYGSDDPRVAAALTNLGAVLAGLGHSAAARTYHEQALTLREKTLGPDHPETAASLNHIGVAFHALGQPDVARVYLEQALARKQKVLPRDHPATVVTEKNLGTVLARLAKPGAPDTAIRPAVQENPAPRQEPPPAETPAETGRFHLARGDFRQALPLLERAVARWEKEAPDSLELAEGYQDLATCRFALGDYAGAVAPLEQALALRQRLSAPEHLVGATLLRSAGQAYTLLGQDALAWRRLTAACATYHRLAEKLRSNGDNRELDRLLPEWHAGVETLLTLVERGAADSSARAQELYACVLAWRAATHPEAAVRRATPGDLAQRLDPDTVLIEFLRFRRWEILEPDAPATRGASRYAAVLYGRSLQQENRPDALVVSLGDATLIDEAVRTWHASARQGRIDSAAEAAVRQRVWNPLAPVLSRGARRLVIAPDGELARLPFAALRLANGRYALERYQFHYLTGGHDLVPRPRPPVATGPALILADLEPDVPAIPGVIRPAVGNNPVPDRPALGIDVLTRILRAERPDWPVEIRRGPGIAPAALTSTTSPRLVVANLPAAQGLPQPLRNLNLHGTELVILPESSTPVQKEALHHAGARTLLAAVLTPPEPDAERLLTRYLRHAQEGRAPAEALHLAQRDLLAALRRDPDPRRRTAAPLYWAGFVTSGR